MTELVPPASTVRIGCGAGFAADRFEPAHDLIRRGHLDYIVFECLAERTLGTALERKRRGGVGYDPMLRDRMEQVLADAVSQGTKIITNAGAADPVAAGEMVHELARERGLSVTVAVIEGDDVLDLIGDTTSSLEHDRPLASYGQVIAANAYLGSGPLVEALEGGADIVITGRTADAALFLAPALFHYGITTEQKDFLANVTLMGHLLECGAQVSGGYFADGDAQDIPDLANVGLPIADVAADGSFTLSKLPDTGGRISRDVVLAQLLYEITDPYAYITPDAVIDVTQAVIEEESAGTIRVFSCAPAATAPEQLKVSVGYAAGFFLDGEVSYMGAHHEKRAQRARDILRERIPAGDELRIEHHSGILEDDRGARYGCTRVRVAARTDDRAAADLIAHELQSLYTNGPAGGSGIRSAVSPALGIVSALVDRDRVETRITWMGAS